MLFLGHNNISDISPLAELVNLTETALHANQISDIRPLIGLANLTAASLDNNQVSNEQIAELRAALPNASIRH
jgi:Leucine-rich repeat (LRR) protein